MHKQFCVTPLKKVFTEELEAALIGEILNTDLFLDKKIILSGGLSIENLENALKINPWCLDFNSGVESAPGFKDHSKITKILSLIEK